MSEIKLKNQENVDTKSSKTDRCKRKNKVWQKPTLEDVSEKIMAQPYIRFT